jgi:hypothetical protein
LSPRKITWEELCEAVVREIDSERLRILAAALKRELSRRKRGRQYYPEHSTAENKLRDVI